MPLSDLEDESNGFIDKFLSLISNCCTFVSDWNSEEVNENMYRLYSKKVPTKKATKEYGERVKRCIDRDKYISHIASDFKKPRGSHYDWY